MQKFLRTLTLLALLVVPWVMQAQSDVVIGDTTSTATDSYLPANSLYEYSYSQQIYTADEIGMGGTINSITLWLKGNANLYAMPLTIYMVETDRTAFTGNTDWETVTASDIVYTGTVTVHNTNLEAYTFELDVPFTYSGTSNLLIAVNNTTGQWKSGLNGMVFGESSDPARSIYVRQDGTAYDPTNPTFTATATTYKRNVIQINITAGSGPVCTKPATLEVSDITAYGATFTWTGEVTNYVFEYKEATEEDWTVVSLATTSYTLSSLDPATSYNVRVKAVCGADSESGYKSVNFQTPCVAINVDSDNPFTEGFEGADFPPICWSMAHTEGTSSSLWTRQTTASEVHTGSASAKLPDQQTGNKTNLVSPLLNIPAANAYQVTFWIKRVSGTKPNEGVKVWVNTTPDTIGDNAQALMHIRRAFSMGEITETEAGWYKYSAVIPTSGDVYIIFEGISEYGNYTSIDDITVDEAPSCIAVTGLAISEATSDAITLSWADEFNTGATYSIYEVTATDTTLLASGISTVSYTVSGLNSNTSYTYAVEANCTADDNAEKVFVSGRTACAAITELPWTDGMEAVSAESNPMPFCWSRYNNLTSGYSYYPYSYNSATNAHEGSRSLYWYYSTYGTYPDTAVAILPELDVTTYPMANNQLSFFGRTGSASAAIDVIVGTMSNPEDITTFVASGTVNVSGNVHTRYDVNLSQAGDNDAYAAIMVLNPGAYISLYIDDVILHEAPSCAYITNLAVIDATSESISLLWSDGGNDNASYSVYTVTADGNELVASGIIDTTYIVAGLDANTDYTFAVEANCPAGDAELVTVSGHTTCEATVFDATEPYEENFDSYTSGIATSTSAPAGYPNITMPSCWDFINLSTSSSSYPQAFLTSSSSYAVSGNCLFFKSSSSTPLYAVMPAIVTDNALQLEYSYRNEGVSASNGTILAGVINGGIFTTLDSCEQTTTITSREVIIPAGALSDGGRIAFCYRGGTTNNYYASIDNVVLGEAPSCLPVADLAASNVTAYGATLTWTGTADSYVVYNMADTSVVATVTAAEYSPVLEPNTQYSFGVKAVCGDDESSIATVSFRTSCAPVALPFVETFDASLSSNPCWAGANGITAAEVFEGTALTLGANSTWTYSSSASNGLEAGHYRVNIYGTNCKKWMVTPEIDLVGSVNPQLSFDVAFTKYSGTAIAEGFDTNQSQAFMVLVSTDNGATWPESYATVWSNVPGDLPLSSLADTNYINEEISLNQFVGQSIRIAFYAQSTVSGGDNNLHLDNVMVSDAYIPVVNDSVLTVTINPAEDPTMGTTDPVPGVYTYTIYDDVTISPVPAEGYVYAGWYATFTIGGYTVSDTIDADVDVDIEIDVVESLAMGITSVELTPLFSEAVVSSCDSVAIPFFEGFENGIDCWTVHATSTSTGLSTYSYEGNAAFSFSYSTEPPQYLISPLLTGTGNGVQVEFFYKIQSTYYPESFQLGYSTTTNDTSAFVWGEEHTNLVNTSYEHYVEILNASNIKYVAIKYTANDMYMLHIDNFLVREVPTCLPVTELIVSDETSSTLTLSWNDTVNSGATYTVYNADNNTVLASGITANNYTVTGLTANTIYGFGVAANCSADESSDIAYVNGITTCADGECRIAIAGTDSYGDGWNGNAINVYYGDSIFTTFTLESGNYNLDYWCLAGDVPMSFSWTSGMYPSEANFVIVGNDGSQLYSDNGGNMVDSSTFMSLADACSLTPIVEEDSLMVIINVNDTTMGTVTPGVGVHYYASSDTNVVVFTATPAAGYSVYFWRATYTYNGESMQQDIEGNTISIVPSVWSVVGTLNLDLYFHEVDTVHLMVAVNDATMGTTIPAPGAYDYEENSTIQLIAVPDSGYSFVQWLVTYEVGDGEIYSLGYSPYDTITVNASPTWTDIDLTFTAYFEEDVPAMEYTVTTIYDSTMGYVTGGGVYTEEDEYFTVTAIPNNGYHFLRWLVMDGDGDTLGYAYVNPFSYYADDNYTVVAFFEADVECTGNTCLLTIEAFDDYGDGWNDGYLTLTQNNVLVSNVMMTEGDSNTYTVQVCSDYPVALTWNAGNWDDEVFFTVRSATGAAILDVDDVTGLIEGLPFATIANVCTNPVVTYLSYTTDITVAVNDATMGTTNPAPGAYTLADTATFSVTAVPNAGYYFDRWVVEYVFDSITYSYEDYDSVLTLEGIYTAAYSPLTITAYFIDEPASVDTLTVVLGVNNAAWGTTDPVPGTYTYTVDDEAEFSAVPADGYYFLGWYFVADGDTEFVNQYYQDISLDVEYILQAGIDNATLTAIFSDEAPIPDTVNITLAVNDPTMGSITPAPGTYQYAVGDDVVVDATPATGYYFYGWERSLSYAGMTYADTTVTANTHMEFEVTDDYVYYAEMGFEYTFTALFTDDSTIVPELLQMQVNVAVNDPTMGTTDPAPGTHYFVEGTEASVVAIPNEGYHLEGWTIQVTMHVVDDSVDTYEVVMDTTFNIAFENVFDLFGGWLVEPGDEDYIWTVTANFAAGAPEPQHDSLTLITAVNNAAWGSITPAPGTHYYVVGDEFDITPTANAGYHFHAFTLTISHPVYGEMVNETIPVDDVDPDSLAEYLHWEIAESMMGYVISFTAIFEADETGIEDVEDDTFTVSVNESTIVVRGAEGKDVTLFDVNGRMLRREARAAENVEFRVNNSGVYLVKVANAAAKRVVVIR